MIYSIGYSGKTPEQLAAVLAKLQIDVLLDIRAKPFSRKPGFSRKALQAAHPATYRWAGDVLGGPGGGGAVTAGGLDLIRELERDGRRVMLLCLEHAPGDCHRHFDVAVALLPDIVVTHVYDNELVLASSLQHAIDNDCEYDVAGTI